MYEMSVPTANPATSYEAKSCPKPQNDSLPLTTITGDLKDTTNENFDLVMRLHEALVGAYTETPVCLGSSMERSTLLDDISADLQVATDTNRVIRDLYERLGLSL